MVIGRYFQRFLRKNNKGHISQEKFVALCLVFRFYQHLFLLYSKLNKKHTHTHQENLYIEIFLWFFSGKYPCYKCYQQCFTSHLHLSRLRLQFLLYFYCRRNCYLVYNKKIDIYKITVKFFLRSLSLHFPPN